MRTIRTFISVHLPGDVKQNIGHLHHSVQKFPAKVRWVPVDNIHLTLKFLGNIDEKLMPEIFELLEEKLASQQSFKFLIEKIGAFRNWRSPRVFWIGCEEDETHSLSNLHGTIENALETLGFQKEKRRFRPHITIGRVKSNKSIRPLCDFLRSASFPSSICDVKSIYVMKSNLKSAGAEYTVLKEILLK